MKLLKVLSSLLFLIISSAQLSKAQQPLAEQLIGTWQGTGMLMGSEATFDMHWEKELDGQFLKLIFQNKRTPKNGDQITFSAIAIYKPAAKAWEGTWFDTRGVSFPLNGTAEKNELTVEWGSPETEQGRTVYALKGIDSMEVTDYILQEGEYTKFGEATYKKVVQNKEPKVIGIGGFF